MDADNGFDIGGNSAIVYALLKVMFQQFTLLT
jgi:hypothetical protein